MGDILYATELHAGDTINGLLPASDEGPTGEVISVTVRDDDLVEIETEDEDGGWLLNSDALVEVS
jgi:hypothetical protein